MKLRTAALLLFASATVPCLGGENAAPAGIVILRTQSAWRCFITLKPNVFGTRDDAAPHEAATLGQRGRPVMPVDQPDTPFPPADWAKPDFDDGAWWRRPGPILGGEYNPMGRVRVEDYEFPRYGYHQPKSVALMCVRGKFTVDDPLQVKTLTLSVSFRGGLVAYLNGEEIARRHMADGDLTFESLADDYPIDATLDKDGYAIHHRDLGKYPGVKERIRTAQGISIPTDRLRKGRNVLALEIHRAALPKECTVKKKMKRRARKAFVGGGWNTVGLVKAELAASGGGIRQNITAPAGTTVWNANPLESIFESNFGDPNEPLGPMRIAAARNGTFAGQVVISSDKPIAGLKAETGPLKHADGKGTIPADRLRLQYPGPTVREGATRLTYVIRGNKKQRPRTPSRFDMLLDAPPAIISIPDLGKDAPKVATQPVWLSVRVPADAAPGSYRGTLTVSAKDISPIEVPVELKVHDWLIPDPKDFTTSVGFLEMPESLADYYKVPAWSDKHWKMIRKSLELLARTGNQVLYVAMVNGTHFRNRETMVRWKKNGNGYEHDFSLMEKYIEIAVETGNVPDLVCLQVWDYHIGSSGRKDKIGTGRYGQSEVFEPRPVTVSTMDDAGKVTELTGPTYADPAAEAFWAPVAEGAKKVLAKHDLDGRIALGICGDYLPIEETVALWRKLLPDAGWVTMAHGRTHKVHGRPVAYSTSVFGASFADPALERKQGWAREEHAAYFPRYADNMFVMGMAYERTFYEFGLLCGLRGAGRQVLDHFHDQRVRAGSGTQCRWGSLTPGPAWLAAGPDGPAATERFEMGIEGIQECEARIFIEKALADEALRAKLGDDLATRCQDLLDEKTRCVSWSNQQNTNQSLHCYLPGGPLGCGWYAGSNWMARTDRLYAAAAAAAKAIK